VQSIAISVSVCMLVSLSYLKTTFPSFTKFCTWHCCVTMAQSCCVDSAIPGYIISLLPDLWMSDVTFSHNGTNGPESKTTLFRWFRQVAVPEAMLLPVIATWFAISRPMKFVLGYHWSAYHRPYEIQTINSNCNRARPCKMIGGRAVCWEDHITCRPSRPYTGVLYFTYVFQIYRFSVLSSFTMLSPMSFVGVFFMVSVTSAQSNINDEFQTYAVVT